MSSSPSLPSQPSFSIIHTRLFSKLWKKKMIVKLEKIRVRLLITSQMWIWWFGTFNSRNALSVQFSRIRTSTSFVIFHSCSATLPLTSLMLFLIWIRKKNDKGGWQRGLQRINRKRKDDVSLFRMKQIVHLFLFFHQFILYQSIK